MGMAGLALAEQTVIWILAVCLGLCLTAFAVGTAWFLLRSEEHTSELQSP